MHGTLSAVKQYINSTIVVDHREVEDQDTIFKTET